MQILIAVSKHILVFNHYHVRKLQEKVSVILGQFGGNTFVLEVSMVKTVKTNEFCETIWSRCPLAASPWASMLLLNCTPCWKPIAIVIHVIINDWADKYIKRTYPLYLAFVAHEWYQHFHPDSSQDLFPLTSPSSPLIFDQICFHLQWNLAFE